jgi:hypothetical protein
VAAGALAAEQGRPVHRREARGAGLRRREEHRVAEEEAQVAEAVEAVAAVRIDSGKRQLFLCREKRLLKEPLFLGKAIMVGSLGKKEARVADDFSGVTGIVGGRCVSHEVGS